MKRLSLVMALGFATISFAMNYTGKVYVHKSSRVSETLYLSVGCTAKNDSGIVEAIGESDIKLVSRDALGWNYEPVKSLVKGDSIVPFCFYSGRPDSTIKSKLLSTGAESYYYEKYYPSSEIFTAKDFDNHEDLYIDFDSNELFYKDVSVPTVFFKSYWMTAYVVPSAGKAVRIKTRRDDNWFVAHDELKFPYIRTNVKTDSVPTDTVNGRIYWKTVYDTLAMDTLYRGIGGKIAFSNSDARCGTNYVYEKQYNVMDYYICFDTKLGIDLASYKSDSIYVFESPKQEHVTLVRTKSPEPVYHLYVLPPQSSAWFSEIPVFVNESTGEKSAMRVYDYACGWFEKVFFEEAFPKNASFIGKNNSALSFAKDVNIDSLFTAFKTTELYYVVNDSTKTHWYKKDPEINGICSVDLQGIVYDTDALLHPSFSCYSPGGEGCQTGAQGVPLATAVEAINECIGLTHGIVESVIGENHKPVLSKAGEKCFIKSDYFNQLFTPTEGVNETSCSSIPFMINESGMWEFLSDAYTSPGAPVMGGYYPVEQTQDKDIVVGNPLEDARTKRLAEGPVFIGPMFRELDSVENVPKMDVLCNGPAWKKGIDCSGLFADGEDLTIPVTKYMGLTDRKTEPCVWGWSCPTEAPEGWPLYNGDEKVVGHVGATPNPISYEPRWVSTTPGRNQHFCFESHAKFTYKKGQKFGVRGDDDIWIFIGGKLAIDLGGTHLAAPGYADLSLVTDKNDEPLVVGKTYDIDIFFCDRRTTMSNMNIFSNFYLDQSESIEQMKPCKVDVKRIFEDDSLSGQTVAQRGIVLPAKIGVIVEGRFASISGVKPGSELTLMDVQGRVVGRYQASSANMKIEIHNAGRYILKTASGLQTISVR